jgi:LicD family
MLHAAKGSGTGLVVFAIYFGIRLFRTRLYRESQMMHDGKTEKECRWINALQEVRLILDSVDFPFFIDTGTLLGAKREKRFIAWDNDIDLGTIRTDETHLKLARASHALLEAGYSYMRSDQGTYFVKSPDIEIGIMFYEKKGDFYTNGFRKVGYRFGFFSHIVYLVKAVSSGFIVDYGGHSLGHKARNILMKLVSKRPFRPETQFSRFFDLQIKEIRIPCRFFDNLDSIDLYGMKLPAPSPPEDYLSLRYGDWQTPVSNYDYFQEDKTIVR